MAGCLSVSFAKQSEIMEYFNGTTLAELLQCMCNQAGQVRHELISSVFKQVLWKVGHEVEKHVARSYPMLGADGRLHGDGDPSEPDAMPQQTMQPLPCYDKKNFRHTSRDLGRYQKASLTSLHNEQNLSFAGPDASKVGTDFACMLSVCLGARSGKAAICNPQVLRVTNRS